MPKLVDVLDGCTLHPVTACCCAFAQSRSSRRLVVTSGARLTVTVCLHQLGNMALHQPVGHERGLHAVGQEHAARV